MKIIEPSFELRTYNGPLTPEEGVKLLRWVEWNSRISHRSEGAQTEDSWKRFIKSVIVDRGDWSVAEHSHVTAVMRVSRGVMFELTRHRLMSFTAESTRFCNYAKKDLDVIKPQGLKSENEETWRDCVVSTCTTYKNLVFHGQSPQEARSVLSNALAATISVTCNLRNWRHFLLMRTTRETHPDFRVTTIPLLVEFKRTIPILFEDIEPNCRQIDNLSKAR